MSTSRGTMPVARIALGSEAKAKEPSAPEA